MYGPRARLAVEMLWGEKIRAQGRGVPRGAGEGSHAMLQELEQSCRGHLVYHERGRA